MWMPIAILIHIAPDVNHQVRLSMGPNGVAEPRSPLRPLVRHTVFLPLNKSTDASARFFQRKLSDDWVFLLGKVPDEPGREGVVTRKPAPK